MKRMKPCSLGREKALRNRSAVPPGGDRGETAAGVETVVKPAVEKLL